MSARRGGDMARTVTLPTLAHSSSSSCWWYFLANLMNSRLPTSSPNLSRFWLTRGLILTNALCLLFSCILTGSLHAGLCLVGDAPSSHTQPDAAQSLHSRRRLTNLRSRSHSWAAMTPGKHSRSDLAHSTIRQEASTWEGTPSNKHAQNNHHFEDNGNPGHTQDNGMTEG